MERMIIKVLRVYEIAFVLCCIVVVAHVFQVNMWAGCNRI